MSDDVGRHRRPSRWTVFVWTYRANRAMLPWLARVVNATIDALTRDRRT